MSLGRIASLSFLVFGFAGTAVATYESSLADAAESGDAGLILFLLMEGADVNVSQVDGMTALHWAVYRDDVKTAGLLVGSGADVNAENRYGVPPLSLACINGNAALVKRLLGAGADPNAALRGGETVLMTAARTGNPEVVDALLAAGADPNAQERHEQTALMWAAAEGHAAVVQTLIDGGADLRRTLGSGFNAMFFAVREGRTEVVRTFLAAGIDVNETLHRRGGGGYKPPRRGTSPLLLAVENGHFELAVALLEAGADPNDQRTGFTPLHNITWVRKPDRGDGGDPVPIGSGNMTSLQFVRALVASGADVNARLERGVSNPPSINRRGATAFLMAADRADVPLMGLLIRLGADPFVPNVENTTPLMAAAGLGTTAPTEEAGTEPEAREAVRLLLELGADIDAVDDNGETAMHGAAYGSFPTVVQFLADSGADAEIWKLQNGRGWTPLFIAEGYRPGNFIPSHATIEGLHRVMIAAGVPTDGPRPRKINEAYEKVVTPKTPAREIPGDAGYRTVYAWFTGKKPDHILGDAKHRLVYEWFKGKK